MFINESRWRNVVFLELFIFESTKVDSFPHLWFKAKAYCFIKYFVPNRGKSSDKEYLPFLLVVKGFGVAGILECLKEFRNFCEDVIDLQWFTFDEPLSRYNSFTSINSQHARSIMQWEEFLPSKMCHVCTFIFSLLILFLYYKSITIYLA